MRQVTRVKSDPYLLRALPNEDVFFFSKRIDTSRIAKQADPRARRECWSAIATSCILALVLTGMLAPSVASILAGYQLQALKQEQQRLLEERRVLDVEEARLLSPERLEQLAKRYELAKPSAGQIIHLNPRNDGALSLNTASTAFPLPDLHRSGTRMPGSASFKSR